MLASSFSHLLGADSSKMGIGVYMQRSTWNGVGKSFVVIVIGCVLRVGNRCELCNILEI